MKKLRLDVEELVVESFVTRLDPGQRGTVDGRQNIILSVISPLGCVATAVFSCICTDAATCPESCDFSCGASCGPACHTRAIGTCPTPPGPYTYDNGMDCKHWEGHDEAYTEAEAG